MFLSSLGETSLFKQKAADLRHKAQTRSIFHRALSILLFSAETCFPPLFAAFPASNQLPEISGSHEGKPPLTRKTCGSAKRKSFPPKSGGILRKRNRREAYRFIDEHLPARPILYTKVHLTAPNSYRITSYSSYRCRKSVRADKRFFFSPLPVSICSLTGRRKSSII